MRPSIKKQHKSEQEPAPPIEPRWPAILASVATGLLYAALPEPLSLGPWWLPPMLVAALIIPVYVAHRRQQTNWNTRLAYVLISLLTVFLLFAVSRLVYALLTGNEGIDGKHLLLSAIALWSTNVFVFTLWYWRLDAGGPNQRDRRRNSGILHSQGCFLFPQMTMDTLSRVSHGMSDWHPDFWDYLFLAFNTSTALSPTDTAVLTRPAKVLMIMQASVSLVILAVLAGRAINILGDRPLPKQPAARFQRQRVGFSLTQMPGRQFCE
jgi:hypothetical protein